MNATAREQAFFLDADGVRLFGVYHPPACSPVPRAVLVCVHPLLEEKKSAHRILVETARTLAASGMAVLRFDLAGCGDSQGALEDQSMSGWVTNVVAAARHSTDRFPGVPMVILGVRMGAVIAFKAALRLSTAARIVLWEPTLDGAVWLRERLRQRLVREMLAAGRGTGEMSSAVAGAPSLVDVDGFCLSSALVREIESVTPLKLTESACSGRILIVQISPMSRPAPALESFSANLVRKGAETELRIVRAAPFWNRLEPHPCPEAATVTLQWMEDALDGPQPSRDKTADEARVFPDVAVTLEDAGEQPLTVDVSGKGLLGIFHPPGGGRGDHSRPAILMLHGWGAYRIGPHRMFVNAARRFSEEGMPVLRFDFGGRGDSQGATTAATIDSMIDDAAEALQALCKTAERQAVVVLGMCSGAKIAAALAARLPGLVTGVVLWSPEPPDAAVRATKVIKAAGGRRDVVGAYIRKSLDARVWRKMFAGGVNWRLVRQALLGRRGPQSNETERDNAVYRAFKAYPGPRLVIFGSADPTAGAASREYRRLAGQGVVVHEEHIVEGADHNFYRADWERQVLDYTVEWLAACRGSM